ncbi:flavin-containing monooxygenase [Nocardia sp. NPDC059240]|uniref:flavin-containing monooxygenase n=1 Tax=Nocardia sp. NPDC059240 TaxID=3346786 RepID=UPI003685C026
MDREIVIVGAGFSGIGVAIKLQQAGFPDFLILEAGDDVGGTWYWNTYPGVAVDIPSFSYQFSFEQRDDWSRSYATGRELRAYAVHCVDKYKLRRNIRFATTVTTAVYDERANLWRLSTSAGTELTARFLINASGVLTQPKRPDIPGVDEFAGLTMHTARWDHTRDLAGRRVGIIGTGASAVQLIPSLAPNVEHLTVFQRTPIWCLPKPDFALSDRARRALRYIPGVRGLARWASQGFVEVTFPLAGHYFTAIPGSGSLESLARAYIHSRVDDPVVRDKLTPRYAPGCKRPSFHNDYYATFNRDNVQLETNSITRICADGVYTADGLLHGLDVLILATGFKVFESGTMPTYVLRGRGGIEQSQWWGENRYQAYHGVSVPGFPNHFSIFGPYGYNGASYFTLIEAQSAHILRCLRHARTTGSNLIEVTRQANDRYFAEMLARRSHQVFWQDSCAESNSYYFTEHGDVPLRPHTTVETYWRSNRFDLDDYEFARGGAVPSRVHSIEPAQGGPQ